MSPRDKGCHRPGSTLVPQQPGASGTHRASTLVRHFAAFQTWPEIQHTGPGPGAENVAGELRPRRNVICSPSGIETLVTAKSPRFTYSGTKPPKRYPDDRSLCCIPRSPRERPYSAWLSGIISIGMGSNPCF